MAIFLCGFMGCGKTTIGKRLATKLGRKYSDMDDMIVKQMGMSIPEIFEKKGEAAFRQAETELIINLKNNMGVIACGGGAMLSDINGENAKKSGTVIFLDVPFETCYMRIKDDPNRPIAASRTKEQLEDLYNERYPKYKKNSEILISCKGSPDRIADTIIQALKDNGVIK